MEMRGKVALKKWQLMLERVNLKDAEWRNTTDSTPEQLEAQVSSLASLAVGVIDHVSTVEELIEGIIHEAEELLDSWQFLKR